MTLEELLAREAIRDTMAKYNTSGDRLKVDDYAACFTEDGVIESESAPGVYIFRYEGREAIRAWQGRWLNREAGADVVHGATFVRHHLATCKIDMTSSDTATARTYWVAWTDIGPDHSGYYLDHFRKTGDDWLIARRRVRRDWAAPDSLFVTAIANTDG
ncbi:MAG: hypothetical protein RLY97_1804 [Pseudomonadota bacterium]|jgi:hypothetical protein